MFAPPTYRTLPLGGTTGNQNFGKKIVDKPNVNSKFSRGKSPSKGGVSTVFDNTIPPEPEKLHKRAGTPAREGNQEAKKEGVRCTGAEKKIMEREAYKQDHPRPLRKSVERASVSPGNRARSPIGVSSADESPAAPAYKEPVISANGIVFKGGRGHQKDIAKNDTSMDQEPAPPKPYAAMERFRASPRLALSPSNVLIPETVSHSSDGFVPKVQRFISSPRRSPSQTLVGVLSPEPHVMKPPPYVPKAPFHTD